MGKNSQNKIWLVCNLLLLLSNRSRFAGSVFLFYKRSAVLLSKVYLAKYLHENQNRFHSSWNHNCRQTFLTFIQQGRISLDGDMCIIIPSESYKPVMKDPFAVNVLLNNKIYASPDRSFAHWTMYSYFRTVPFFCNCSPNKIDSIYASRLLRKHWFRHFSFSFSPLARNKQYPIARFLIPAAVISFLFQIYDLNSVLGLIQSSITYTFFYSLPLYLILYLFHSLYFLKKNGWMENARNLPKKYFDPAPVFLFPEWALNTGVAIIACPLILLYLIWKNRKQMYNSEGNLQLKQTYQLVPKSVRIVFHNFHFFQYVLSLHRKK